MNQADVVRRYLHEPRDVDFCDTGLPLITISREAGTEAHAIGRFILMRLAEYADPDLNTGWDLFDQKLCALIAQNKALDADYDMLVNDKYRGGGLHRLVYELLIGTPQEYRIQKKIEEVVLLLARLGQVVIIGRGGFQIARHIPGAIHLRLVAPMDYRVQDVMKHDQLTEEAAQEDPGHRRRTHPFPEGPPSLRHRRPHEFRPGLERRALPRRGDRRRHRRTRPLPPAAPAGGGDRPPSLNVRRPAVFFLRPRPELGLELPAKRNTMARVFIWVGACT